jgi:triphosphatase
VPVDTEIELKRRKAGSPSYGRDATAVQAFGAVLDDCLSHISRSAIGLADGDPEQRIEHVHQMRVGIRRLRSALRCFDGWVPAPPAELVEPLRGVFATLGRAREADVLGTGVAAALTRAGAPPLGTPAAAAGRDPAEVARSAEAQQLMLGWRGWRAALDAAPGAAVHDASPLGRLAQKRLRRWHRQLAGDCRRFDQLDETALHTLRKRIKRQRYAVEFLAPVLRRKQAARYLDALSAIQERMGELNDLFVARGRYHAMVSQEPGAWFALGWLAARTEQQRALAAPQLHRAVKVQPPVARR